MRRAAIFAAAESVSVDEEYPKLPLTPFGCAKSMVEAMLADYGRVCRLKSVCLQGFDAAPGSDPEGEPNQRRYPDPPHLPEISEKARTLAREALINLTMEP